MGGGGGGVGGWGGGGSAGFLANFLICLGNLARIERTMGARLRYHPNGRMRILHSA